MLNILKLFWNCLMFLFRFYHNVYIFGLYKHTLYKQGAIKSNVRVVRYNGKLLCYNCLPPNGKYVCSYLFVLLFIILCCLENWSFSYLRLRCVIYIMNNKNGYKIAMTGIRSYHRRHNIMPNTLVRELVYFFYSTYVIRFIVTTTFKLHM